MTTATNEEALADLRRRADAAQQGYMQTLGEIKAQRAQLDDAMAGLAELGCPTVADAEGLAQTLQDQIDTQLTEIRRLLG